MLLRVYFLVGGWESVSIGCVRRSFFDSFPASFRQAKRRLRRRGWEGLRSFILLHFMQHRISSSSLLSPTLHFFFSFFILLILSPASPLFRSLHAQIDMPLNCAVDDITRKVDGQEGPGQIQPSVRFVFDLAIPFLFRSVSTDGNIKMAVLSKQKQTRVKTNSPTTIYRTVS